MHMPPGNGSTMRCDDRKIRPNDIPAKDPIATDGQKAGVGKTRLRGMEGKRIVYLFPVSKKKKTISDAVENVDAAGSIESDAIKRPQLENV